MTKPACWLLLEVFMEIVEGHRINMTKQNTLYYTLSLMMEEY